LTDEEIGEVTHLAMTVGASRIKVMADAEMAKLTAPPAPDFVAAPVPAQAEAG
jgi:hypothetical protein